GILDAFYDNEYRKLYKGNEAPTEKEINFQFVRGRNQALLIASEVKAKKIEINRYLDIGCSAGSHLISIGELIPQVDLYGIEPGTAYREHCNKMGIKAFKNLEELLKLDLKFDAISISHVLEHIHNPVEYLRYLRKELLNDNGVILIEVPNTLGGHGAFEIAHPICFTKKTLKETMQLSGLDQIEIITHNITQSKRDLELYLLAIGYSSKYESISKVKKANYLITKFLRRRGSKKEDIITTIKILAKELIK
ncbi:MAG: class I SAM-dependent methyltransferase, partial [Cyclobacteriaceae bacterium]